MSDMTGTTPARARLHEEAARARALAREELAARAASIRAATAPGTPLRDEEDAAGVTAAGSGYGGSGGAVALPGTGGIVPFRPAIDGDQVLRYIYTYLSRFAVWGSDEEIVAATLWIAQTHARDDNGYPPWPYAPGLGVFGPSGSGKSWKCRLIGKLSYKGKILLEPTKPSFIDECADQHTVIITEADELFATTGRSRGILATVNAAYEPDRTHTRKHAGKVQEILVFTHTVLDGLDTMLASTRTDLRTMISRRIVLMARKAPDGYRPPRFDKQARYTAELLSQRASGWMAQEMADGMAEDVPQVPEHLGNRPFALWEPLFTVALRADKGDSDGPWSTACRSACEYLEANSGLAQPELDDDGESELDRQMAAYSLGEDEF